MADKKKVEKADSNKKGTDRKKTGPASTIPKKVSNKDIRKARQAAKAKKERIPAGMDPKDYADAAFKKKVTIIMGSILLAFIIGLVVFLLITKDKYDFDGQRDEIRAELAAAGDDEAKRAEVKIELNEENHNYWITTLNASYQLPLLLLPSFSRTSKILALSHQQAYSSFANHNHLCESSFAATIEL